MVKSRIPMPKLRLIALSSYVADLVLVGAGEEQAVHHKMTRRAWHVFIFSFVAFLVWHFLFRLELAPSFQGNVTFFKYVRLAEATVIGYLIIALFMVVYLHYRHMLLPGKNSRFTTIVFFFVMATILFARLYYSIIHYDACLFNASDSIVVEEGHFGLYGLEDLRLSAQCLGFSCCTMLNRHYSALESNSLAVSWITIVESLCGYLFVEILIATFVQSKSTSASLE